jgi:hypothetical protein
MRTLRKGGIGMKLCALTAAIFLAVTGLALGADIDGTWTGTIQGPDGGQGFPISYTFKAEGTTLTGSMPGMPGPDGSPAKPVPIKDGKIDGNKISFSVSFDMGGQEMKMDYKGVLSGDSLKISFDAMGTPMEFTLKKSK